LQNPQKYLQCRKEIFVAGESLPSDLKNGCSLFLGDHYQGIKSYTSASSRPEVHPAKVKHLQIHICKIKQELVTFQYVLNVLL